MSRSHLRQRRAAAAAYSSTISAIETKGHRCGEVIRGRSPPSLAPLSLSLFSSCIRTCASLWPWWHRYPGGSRMLLSLGTDVSGHHVPSLLSLPCFSTSRSFTYVCEHIYTRSCARLALHPSISLSLSLSPSLSLYSLWQYNYADSHAGIRLCETSKWLGIEQIMGVCRQLVSCISIS